MYGEIMRVNFNLAFKKLWAIAFVLLTLPFFVGCDDDDDPVSPNADHFEAVGVYIHNNGVKTFDYFGPNITNPDTVLGPLELNVGDNGHWDIQFYNNSKEVIDGPDESNKFMVLEIKDTSIVQVNDAHNEVSSIVKSSDGWIQYQFNSGIYEAHIKGIQPNGETRLRVKVYHVDHYDFTSPEIKVAVRNQATTNLVKLLELSTELTLAYLNDPSVNDYYSTTFSDTLKLSAAGSKTLEAQFFTANMMETQSGYDIVEGSQFTPGVPVHSLKVESSNTGIATIDQTGLGDWEFKITGDASGMCNITVYIYHEDHIGKTFHNIPVIVE